MQAEYSALVGCKLCSVPKGPDRRAQNAIALQITKAPWALDKKSIVDLVGSTPMATLNRPGFFGGYLI